MSKNYELVKRIAVIGGKQGGVTKEVNLVKWGVFDPMIDIRRWQKGEPSNENPILLCRLIRWTICFLRRKKGTTQSWKESKTFRFVSFIRSSITLLKSKTMRK